MEKKKKKVAKSKRQWFGLETPFKMAMACKSLQPYFTAHQISSITGVTQSHVQKTLSVWKAAGLITDVGAGRRGTGQGSTAFFLYSITGAFDKKLKEASAKRPKAEIKQIKSAEFPSPVIEHLKVIAERFEMLGKILG
jgi:hypothetical protein